MKAIKIILAVFICFIFVLVGVYFYYGGNTKVEFHVKEVGGEKLVYREIKGDYGQTANVIRKLKYDLEQENIKTLNGFGIYYDNPQVVEKSKLHSDAGCILQMCDTSKVFWLRSKFNIKTSPKTNYITTAFPFKGQMSITMGILKVYPAMMKYLKDNGYSERGPIMEIYDTQTSSIIYRKEAVKKGDEVIITRIK